MSAAITAWLRANGLTLFLALLGAWVLGSRFGWWLPAEKDDPTAPLLRLDAQNWEAQVLKSRRPVLVDFWATWCPPCRAQGPIVSQLAKAVSATAAVGKVDVEAQPDLASRYGISSIPALLVFKDGKVVDSFVGLTSMDTLQASLKRAAGN